MKAARCPPTRRCLRSWPTSSGARSSSAGSGNWSQTEAAEKLHIPLSTLNQKIKRLSIEIKRKGGAAG